MGRREGLFSRSTFWTVVPVISIGFSGILVGFVTKVAGGVRKVLATITGLVLTCILQHCSSFTSGSSATNLPLSANLFAVPLVAVGVYLHASFPPLKYSKDE